MNPSRSMAQAVKAAISASRLTQAEVARRADMALNTFSRRMTGSVPFTWPELVRIAAVLGVSCTDLVASAEGLVDA